MLLSLVEVKRN